jgi:hypothetical protein
LVSDGDQWLDSRQVHFIPGEKAFSVHWTEGSGENPSLEEKRKGKMSNLLGFEHQVLGNSVD